MSFLQKHKQIIQLMPIFLLTLGCSIDKGWFMAIALVIHVSICRLYGEPLVGEMWHSTLYKKSWIAIVLFIGTMVLSFLFNHGDIREIGHYFERVAPFLLFGIIAKSHDETPKAFWYGIVGGLSYLCMDTGLNYNFFEDRLEGSFGNPLGLASVLTMLIPFVLFGSYRRFNDDKWISMIAIIVSFVGLLFSLQTGARSGVLAIIVCVFISVGFMIRLKKWKILTVIIGMTLIVGFIGFFGNHNTIADRVHIDITRNTRIYLFEASEKMIKENPIVGVGVKRWGKIYYEKYEQSEAQHTTKGLESPHNIFLHSLCESGVIGFTGFIYLIGFQFINLIKSGFLFVKQQEIELKWTVGVFLTFMSMIVYGQFDYAFYGRYVMSLFWLFWGFAVYSIQRNNN